MAGRDTQKLAGAFATAASNVTVVVREQKDEQSGLQDVLVYSGTFPGEDTQERLKTVSYTPQYYPPHEAD